MNSISGKYVATCLWLIIGIVLAPDLRAQTSLEILDRLEKYNSSTCQIIFMLLESVIDLAHLRFGITVTEISHLHFFYLMLEKQT